MSLPQLTRCQAPADAYRRQARRLRATISDTAALHRSLQSLAWQTDFAAAGAPVRAATARRVTRNPANLVAATWNLERAATPCQLESLVDHIRAELAGGVLNYSRRLSLFRRAARLGIRRFEANLLIATVQYEHDRSGHHRDRQISQVSTRSSSSRWATLGLLAVTLVSEGLVLAHAWNWLHH